MDIKITKKLIEKMQAQEVKKAIYNGYISKASIDFCHNKVYYTFTAEYIHPMMLRFSGNRNVVAYTMSFGEKYSKVIVNQKDVPQEFNFINTKLLKEAVYGDRKAEELYDDMMEALGQFRKEMNMC